MKKSFPANLNGTVYYIDEDAYTLLDRYLKELHHTFTGATGEEIVSDIESRISEHFDANGTNVVVMADVEKVISIIGSPELLGEEEVEAAATDVRDIPVDGEPAGSGAQTPPPYNPTYPQSGKKHLFRDTKDAVFGGVFSGLSYYLGWNTTAMRILYVVAALCSYFWPLTCLYLVAWMLIPAARTPKQILEMYGEPVNITTIGQTLVDGIKNVDMSAVGDYSRQTGSWFNRAFQTLGRIFMAIIGGVAAVCVFILAIMVIVFVCALIMSVASAEPSLIHNFGFDDEFQNEVLGVWFAVMACMACIIPLTGLAYCGLMALFNATAPARATVVTLIIIEALVIVASIVLYNLACPGADGYTAWALPLATMSVSGAPA